MFRGFLVYTPSCLFFHACFIFPCHWMLCSWHYEPRLYPNFPFLFRRTLPWLHELEIYHLAWYSIFRRACLPRDTCAPSHTLVKGPCTSRRYVCLLSCLIWVFNLWVGAMELRIVKPSFKYTAGQWLFLQIPELSRWQWHPVCNPSP